jgi:hypothetical protein
VEVDHAVAEAVLVQELQPQADVVGEGPVAPADHDWREEQVELVDQARPSGPRRRSRDRRR